MGAPPRKVEREEVTMPGIPEEEKKKPEGEEEKKKPEGEEES